MHMVMCPHKELKFTHGDSQAADGANRSMSFMIWSGAVRYWLWKLLGCSDRIPQELLQVPGLRPLEGDTARFARLLHATILHTRTLADTGNTQAALWSAVP